VPDGGGQAFFAALCTFDVVVPLTRAASMRVCYSIRNSAISTVFAPRQDNLCMQDCAYVYPEVRQNEVSPSIWHLRCMASSVRPFKQRPFLIEGHSLSKSPIHAKACPRSVILCHSVVPTVALKIGIPSFRFCRDSPIDRSSSIKASTEIYAGDPGPYHRADPKSLQQLYLHMA
jgi:hypothetical protein